MLDQMKKQAHFAYMMGYPDMTFGPNNDITRDEVTAMFGRLLTGKMNPDGKFAPAFYDVAEEKWSKDWIGYMKDKKIIIGYEDGSFRPNNAITRAEFAAIASRFDNLSDGSNMEFNDVNEGHWAVKYIKSAAKKGWVNGYEDGSFRPDNFITRAEVVAVTNRMLERIADKHYVDEHGNKIKYYKDVDTKNWAYYDIQEASNGHDYKRNEKGGENWSKLWDLFFPNSQKK